MMSRRPQRTTKLAPLEFRVFRNLKSRLEGRRVLVACSGGADSVALALVMARLASRLGFEMAIAHVHHGPSVEKKVERARLKARNFVVKLAERLELRYYSADSPAQELHSEEALRKFRHQTLSELRKIHGFDFVALAHHADDLLETRLIRLIRGTGPQGLKSMSLMTNAVLRPFLDESRADLEAYLVAEKQKWLNDPTNRSEEPLRNWLRRNWLKALERKRPGGGKSLARSLKLLVEALDQNSPDFREFLSDGNEAIRRDLYQRLGPIERRQLLARYLRARGLKNFSENHIMEICKRLDSAQKVFTFELLRSRWEINAQQISVVVGHKARR
jgi:tRNA(Ile)-lysidine synthase